MVIWIYILVRHLVALLPLITLLAPAAARRNQSHRYAAGHPGKGRLLLSPAHSGAPLGGDFANNPNTARFIDKMVQEHGFDRQQLHVLAQARRLDSVLRLMDRQAPTPSTGANRAEWLLAALPQQVHHAG